MSKKLDSLTRRISRAFDDAVKKSQVEKVKNGTANIRDRRTFSSPRITLAMTRHTAFEKMMKDITNESLEPE